MALRDAVLERLAIAPLYTPRLPKTGAPMRARQSNFGALGWVTGQARGYRYEPAHPETGLAWPEMPPPLLDLWDALADWPAPPEACLVNFYDAQARMGVHADADEIPEAPVISVSLGDTALFRIGGTSRRDPTRSFKLASGDVLILAGPARRAFHGVDRIYPGTSTLLEGGGRISLTLRRVTA